MRTKTLNIAGAKVEAVLSAGGPGFKLYMIPDGFAVVQGKATTLVHEADEAYSLVARYNMLRYQPLSEHSEIKDAFNKFLRGELCISGTRS